MQLSRKIASGVLVAGLVLGVGQASWARPTEPPAGSGPARTGAGAVTVTLLTGDRVTLPTSDATSGSVQPARNREHIHFLTSRERNDLYVIPQDAQHLVRIGKLDRRLFNVSALVRYGYHDAARDNLPLLVSYRGGAARRTAAGTFSAAGTRVIRDLPAIGGAAVTADKDQTASLWEAVTTAPNAAARADTTGGVDRIWLDGKRRVALDHSVPQIGAPAAYQAGYTGQGVTVAVLDTGVDAEHPDLAGKVADSQNFSEDPEPGDTVGHGTHIASTIAGSGAASGGKYRGVAPDATLISGKVCESYFCTDSAMLAGLQWAAVDKQATVVNFSIGGQDGPEIDPLEEAVNTLTEQTGTLFVIAAGNSGSARTIGSPGSAEAALTVGAVDRDDQLADFSSRGPRIGDDGIKPDITAPGVNIVAAQADGTEMGEPIGDGYISASGTSMATPHVVGAVALLAQQHPDWTAEQFKATLTASAKPHPGLTAYQQGAGRVDVARAIIQTVTTDPVSLSYGRTIWPHNDDEPIVRTVTYRNTGTTEITLDLAVRVTGPGGAAPPAGMFRTSADQIAVPAGGQAQVSVTTDTSVGGPDGYWSGRLLATGGSVQVSTALGVHQEVESYDLTLTHIDATGAPGVDYTTFVVGLDDLNVETPYASDGTVTVRVPKGRYGLTSWLHQQRDEERWDTATLVQPVLEVREDTSVTLDARQAKPVRVTMPEPSAVPAVIDVSHVHRTADGAGAEFGVLADDFDGVLVGHLGPAVSGDEFVAVVNSQWAKPDTEGRFDNTPYLYAVGEASAGRMFDGYAKHYRKQELATVRHQFHDVAIGGLADRAVFPFYESGPGGWAIVLPVAVPGQRVEHYSVKGVSWSSDLFFGELHDEGWLDFQAVLRSQPTRYQAGRSYLEQWNTAPFGPSLPISRWPESGVTRQGDTIFTNVPLFSDSAGRAGYSLTDTGRIALYRQGKLVGESDDIGWGEFPVPSGRANYRLEMSATRSVSDLTTRVEAAWTFRSGHVDGDGYAKLPVMVVGFAPTLSTTNTAPAGRSFDIPVTVTGQPGWPTPKVKKLAVEVSYDDGKTWRSAKVQAGKHGWTVTVRHPAGAGYASLRAKATDKAGNTITQSIIHAYRLR